MKSLLFALLLAPVLAFAHEGHKHSLTATAEAAAKGAVKAAESIVVEGAAAVTTGAKVAPKLDWPVLLKASMTTHRHNRVVHFPIALGIVGCLLWLMSLKAESLRPGARWVLFFAAVASIVAIFTGRAQQDSIETEAAKQVMELHEALGYSVAAGLWLCWLLTFVESSKKWLWFVMLLLCGLILATGSLGGIIAHMQF